MSRKPRILNNNTGNYPKVEVFDGVIYIQAVRCGKWKKMTLLQAQRLVKRTKRIIAYIKNKED